MEKSQNKNIVFIILTAVTAVAFGLLCLWAASGDGSGTAVIEAETGVAEGYRLNYLVGEEVPADGVYIVVDGERKTGVEVSCDTTSAGIKRATVSYSQDGKTYGGYILVNVYAVRHYAMQSVPEIVPGADGSPVIKKMDFRAEISEIPSDFSVAGGYRVITLPETAYTATIAKSDYSDNVYSLVVDYYGGSLRYDYYLSDGKFERIDLGGVSAAVNGSGDNYSVTLSYGSKNRNYYYTKTGDGFVSTYSDDGFIVAFTENGAADGIYNLSVRFADSTKYFAAALVGDGMIMLDSPDRILSFKAEGDTEAKMVLLVTETENNQYDGANGASGYYIYLNGSERKALRFSYYLDGWSSVFRSSNFGEGVSEVQDGDDYLVSYGGNTFRAVKDAWHKAILGW